MSTSQSTSCLLCGTPMVGVHCKQICPACGYKEDCSDLFPECAYDESVRDQATAAHEDRDECQAENESRDCTQRRSA